VRTSRGREVRAAEQLVEPWTEKESIPLATPLRVSHLRRPPVSETKGCVDFMPPARLLGFRSASHRTGRKRLPDAGHGNVTLSFGAMPLPGPFARGFFAAMLLALRRLFKRYVWFARVRSLPPSLPVHFDETQLLAYLDGELTRSKREEVSNHLRSCWTCRGRLRELHAGIEVFLTTRNTRLGCISSVSEQRIEELRERLLQITEAETSCSNSADPPVYASIGASVTNGS
jgi:hypothetical protein